MTLWRISWLVGCVLVGFGFRDVATGTMTVSTVVTPLSDFPVETILAEGANHFLAMVETDAEKVLGSYASREHGACMAAKLPNGGRLNRVFDQMVVPYGPRPLPDTVAFIVAMKKCKANVSRETVVKKAKLASVKVAPVKAKYCESDPATYETRSKRYARDRVGSGETYWVSKKFCFSDMPSSSQNRCDEGVAPRFKRLTSTLPR
jgi:hypothetical protein